METIKHWKKAMEGEIDSLLRKKTWESVKPKEGRNTIHNKWVDRIKHESKGNKERYKARWW